MSAAPHQLLPPSSSNSSKPAIGKIQAERLIWLLALNEGSACANPLATSFAPWSTSLLTCAAFLPLWTGLVTITGGVAPPAFTDVQFPAATMPQPINGLLIACSNEGLPA